MEAEHDWGAGRFFHAQPLGADRHAPIAADLDCSAHAPYIIPPRAAGRGPQDGAFFFPGLIPRPLRGLAQFPVDYLGGAMGPQGVDVRVGFRDFHNLFAGEVGRQAALPGTGGRVRFCLWLEGWERNES